MPKLISQYRGDNDLSRTFALERAASLNPPNLMKFWQQLNKAYLDLKSLELITKQELEYLHKAGHDDQIITRKIRYCGATAEYWPYRIMNEALEQLKQGENIDIIRKQIAKNIEATKIELFESTEKDANREGILLKTIESNNIASYAIIRNTSEIDAKLPHLSKAQLDYIKMTANQAHIAGSSIAAWQFSDIPPIAAMHYHCITVDSRTSEQVKVSIKHSTLYKPIQNSEETPQQMYCSVERGISQIQYQEINGVKFLNSITGKAEFISTHINDKTRKLFDSDIKEIEDNDLMSITNAAAECIINDSLIGANSEKIEENAAKTAASIVNFKVKKGTLQDLKNIDHEINKAKDKLANIKSETNAEKIAKIVFEAIEFLLKAIQALFSSKTTKHSNHVQNIINARNEQKHHVSHKGIG